MLFLFSKNFDFFGVFDSFCGPIMDSPFADFSYLCNSGLLLDFDKYFFYDGVITTLFYPVLPDSV